MEGQDRIFSRIVNAKGLTQWFVKTSEGLLGPFASWQESRSSLEKHLMELGQQIKQAGQKVAT